MKKKRPFRLKKDHSDARVMVRFHRIWDFFFLRELYDKIVKSPSRVQILAQFLNIMIMVES